MGSRNEQLSLPRPIPEEAEWYKRLMPGVYHRLTSLIVGEAWLNPASAQEILETRNIGNRKPPLKRQIEMLRRSMTDGRFLLTGETIIFDSNGHLRNGQHRLFACVESGVPIPILVVIGVHPETFRLLDQHTKRTTAQVLGIHDFQHTHAVAGAITYLTVFLRNGTLDRRTAGAYGLTIDEQLLLLAKHPGLRDSAAFVTKLASTKLFCGPSLVATCHYIFGSTQNGTHSELANTFFTRIVNGTVPEEPNWHAASLLVLRLQDNRIRREKLPIKMVAALTVKAWNSVVSGRPLRVLKWLEDEDFPRVVGYKYADGKPLLPAEAPQCDHEGDDGE